MCKKEIPNPQRQMISGKSSYEQDKQTNIHHSSPSYYTQYVMTKVNSLYIHSLFGTQQCSGIALKQTL